MHCWPKADVLRVCFRADLNDKYRKGLNRSTAVAVDEVIGLLNSVFLHKKEWLFEECVSTVVLTEKEMRIWADVEGNDDVQEALVKDTLDGKKKKPSSVNNAYLDGLCGDRDDEETVKRVLLPSGVSLMSVFQSLEELAFLGSVTRVPFTSKSEARNSSEKAQNWGEQTATDALDGALSEKSLSELILCTSC